MIDWDSCVLWLDNKYFGEYKWWDRSKYNNDGVVYGAKWKEDSFYFDGVNDAVNCGNNESLRIDDEISIEFLFIPYSKGYIVMKKNLSSWNNVYGAFWGYEGSNKIRFNGNNTNSIESLNVFYANEKQHVVITAKQGDKTKFYKNGEFLNQLSTPTFSGDGDALVVGARTEGSSYVWVIKAKIYYIRIFHKILNEDEIKILARAAGV